MRVIRSIKQKWNRQSITGKFSLAFGLLLLMILLVSVGSYLMLNTVRKRTEAAILNSMRIGRLVLQMDADMERARRLQRDFFLRYPQVGYADARATYAQQTLNQIDEVISLSKDLKQVLAESGTTAEIERRNIDLNLYLSA